MLAALLVMPGGMALNFIFPSGPTACGLTASRRFTIRWGPLYSFLPTSRHDPARFGQGFLGFFGFLAAGFRFLGLGFWAWARALLRVFAAMLVGFNLGVLFFLGPCRFVFVALDVHLDGFLISLALDTPDLHSFALGTLHSSTQHSKAGQNSGQHGAQFYYCERLHAVFNYMA